MRDHVQAEFFARALSQRIGRPVLVEVARSYQQVAEELAANTVDMVWATAEQCDHFAPTARAVLRAVRSGRWYYSAALLCRAAEPLTLERLHGKRAAWVDPLSTGGYLQAVRHLRQHGLNPDEVFSEQRFHGSYRQALLAVLHGEADVTSIFTAHANAHMVHAALAERLGIEARRLTPFAFTEPRLADGLILTSRLSEADATALVSAFTRMSREGSDSEPLLGLFYIEGFTLASSLQPEAAPQVYMSRRSEYLAVDLDEQERCQRLWSSTGTAFGRKLRDEGGRSLAEVLPPEAAVPLEALVRTARQSGVGGRAELSLEVDGAPRVYSAEVVLRPTSEGEEPGLALLVRDVTGQQALETELYRLASFPQLHPEPMMELELEGAPRYANPAAHMAFPDLLWRGVSHPVVEAALKTVWRGSPNEGPPQVSVGGRHWELVVSHLRDIGVIRVFAKDVTARKQLEASLLHADRMSALGRLAAGVGHQMNNPLAFLMANLSFAREEIVRLRAVLRLGTERVVPQEIDDVVDSLSESLEGAERLKTIVEDLRLLAREPPRHKTKVNVHPVLEDTLKLVRNELRHRARLEKDFQPVPLVEADESRLGQVFLNLMLNAVQAMSDQQAASNVLLVATRTSPAGEVVVEVSDTGAGMPPEVLSRLFEPFFTTRSKGVGMGLSVSHAIVTSLGGTLRAESQPGVGTRFTVTLPAV
jgi:signal transduction histidine kinase/ABC-type phosphate/phosphonate transport system substrate-binding protein